MKPIVIGIIIALVCLNLFSFILMGIDKRRAQAGRRRISEKALFTAAGAFGGLGGTLGMYFFRHKTKHWYFVVFFPLMLAAQVGILVYIFSIV